MGPWGVSQLKKEDKSRGAEGEIKNRGEKNAIQS